MNKPIKWSFDNDKLFEPVITGKKRGTCRLYHNKKSLSKIGEINIIYNSKKEQVKIKITDVHKCRFCDIDENWAKTEDEGDLSLEYWKTVHKQFFRNIKPYFTPTDMLELNEFMKTD